MSDAAEALRLVFNEARAVVHRLRALAVQLHRQGENTGGRRGVMEGLYRGGPQTVPQMARARTVSRQHIQTLVNELLRDRLVELAPNPAHQRSPRVRLTPKGKALFEVMLRRESALFARIGAAVPENDLRCAAAVLDAVRRQLESSQPRRRLLAARRREFA
jgi:DNA-binding MarR family transcriptional regulator